MLDGCKPGSTVEFPGRVWYASRPDVAKRALQEDSMSVCLALEHFEPWYFQIGVGVLLLGTVLWILGRTASRGALFRYLLSFRQGLGMDLVGCLVLCVVSAGMAVSYNSVGGSAFPLIAREPYQIYVPCPETELVAEKRTVDELVLSGVLREDLGEPLFRSDVLLVDARPEEQYRQGHIEGAVNVPYNVLSGVAEGDVERLLALRGKNRLVVYCGGWNGDQGNTSSSGGGGVLENDVLKDDVLKDDLLQDDLLKDDVLKDDLLQDDLLKDDVLKDDVLADGPESDGAAQDSRPSSVSEPRSPPSEHLADELKSRDDMRDRFFQVISVEGGILALKEAGLKMSSVDSGRTP